MGLVAALTLAGCAELGAPENGFLPSRPGLTDKTESMINHWNGAWVAALAVAVLVWGLLIWCVIAYRKRKNDNALPVQLRYHIPLELMYTVVPILMIGVLYFYTVQVTEDFTETSAEPDLQIQAYGKQWSWDFNYLTDGVYYEGGRVQLTGEEGVEETLPTLYLPVGETVEFIVDSRDVIHSFWIPAFLFKIDMIPGNTNVFQVTPQEIGSYQGKCAELCGEFHSEMLFNVEVVDRETYDAEMDALREAGFVGERGAEYNRVYDQRGYLQDGTGNN
ncbi:cytochrome c oxidase subunit II [Georgenia sp. 311]|uniref:cytochrome-c oxidase n=1 Tax=Georgenia wutianyii TaxID=2585135 RepID=A0ABX5VQH8_9MICO|nr:cytochrome c oxidase subunit II [Georgenia wutianyii]TNC19586.1 cytochrome c oxidase subunit II [Georgenia sp. 311]